MSMTKPLLTIFEVEFSFKNLLLICGGVFLIIKSGVEINRDIKHKESETLPTKKIITKESFWAVIVQIVVVDFIFSFDSIITAVGMTTNIPIIIAAVVVAMSVMLFASDKISQILSTYPSLKIMALAFIFLIGVILLADGLHLEVSKVYLYFALFFSITVESLNILAGANKK